MAQSVPLNQAAGGIAASLLQVLCTFTGNAVSGSSIITPPTITNSSSVMTMQEISIAASTFVALSPGSGQTVQPSGVIIVLPNANTFNVFLKNVTGDATGIQLAPNGIAVLTFPVGTLPAVGLLTGAGVGGVVGIQLIWF